MKETSKLTTKEISLQAGIPEPTLEKLFAGVTKDPKLETMRQLVHFFGYTLDDLEGSSEKAEKSSSMEESTLRDEREQEIMRLVGTMSSEQKDFFLALLQTTVARNQRTLVVDPLLAAEAAPKSEHHDPTR